MISPYYAEYQPAIYVRPMLGDRSMLSDRDETSPADVAVHELAVELRTHVVVYEPLLLLHLARLVAEHSVLIPTLGQRERRVHQWVTLQQLTLPVGHRSLVLLLPLVQFLLFTLLLYFLVLPQQLLTVVIPIGLRLRVDACLLGLLLLTIVSNKLLRVSIFGERVIGKVEQFLVAIEFDSFGGLGFVVADDIDIVTVDVAGFAVGDLLLLDCLQISVFDPPGSRLPFEQVGFEVHLLELCGGALAELAFLEFEVAGQVLNRKRGTLAEYERVGV